MVSKAYRLFDVSPPPADGRVWTTPDGGVASTAGAATAIACVGRTIVIVVAGIGRGAPAPSETAPTPVIAPVSGIVTASHEPAPAEAGAAEDALAALASRYPHVMAEGFIVLGTQSAKVPPWASADDVETTGLAADRRSASVMAVLRRRRPNHGSAGQRGRGHTRHQYFRQHCAVSSAQSSVARNGPISDRMVSGSAPAAWMPANACPFRSGNASLRTSFRDVIVIAQPAR